MSFGCRPSLVVLGVVLLALLEELDLSEDDRADVVVPAGGIVVSLDVLSDATQCQVSPAEFFCPLPSQPSHAAVGRTQPHDRLSAETYFVCLDYASV